MDASPEDLQLIQFFLRHTEAQPQMEAAALIGVGQKTVSRWRNGEIGPLRERTRVRLAEFRNSQEKAEALDWDSPAGQLVRAYTRPGALRAWAGRLLKRDVIRAILFVAQEEGLGEDQIAAVRRWGDEWLKSGPEIKLDGVESLHEKPSHRDR